MTYFYNTIPSAGIDFATAYTISTSTPEYPGSPIELGTTILGTDGSRWTLCKLEAASTCTAGDALIVTTNSTWEVKALTNTLGVSKLGQLVGIAGATGTAGQYVWMQVAGYNGTVNAVTGSAAFTALHSSATGGRLTSTAAAATSVAINGIVILATAASNVAAAVLTNPVVGAND
mgnify:FL=1